MLNVFIFSYTFCAELSKTGIDEIYCWWASTPLLLRSDLSKILN